MHISNLWRSLLPRSSTFSRLECLFFFKKLVLNVFALFLLYTGAPHATSKPEEVSVGDHVRIRVDDETLKAMQEGHGGWNDLMRGAS